MRIHATMSGSDLLLIVIAIRLAALVLAGWGLTLLPHQTRDGELVCIPTSAARIETQPAVTTVSPRLADAAFDDMRLRD
ncbi:hypothetical protein G8O24_18690 [Bradyrhizobium sp. INPA01-394B]|uniref:Uncharacterized protein n=2 Tax=Bradyrhizobium campsiandrae TaxID=1729892 RepID=A0ABR7UIQ9_9BRAD|nr:hypothetical protein [Bradyrhizobium campsiandrae]MBC9983354.1 hypothetical protein [Bradyrhizobium campsiandrae]